MEIKTLLHSRAQLLQSVRSFFSNNNILEVETPVLSQASNPDPHIESIACELNGARLNKRYYMQTSPEFHMKRLLAQQSGAIYQISKSFRNGEAGSKHNPEFSLLEWYVPGFTHVELMAQCDSFLQALLGTPAATSISYEALFLERLNLNPHTASLDDCFECARVNNIRIHAASLEFKDAWLDLLFSHCIEPHLGFEAPVMVYDYPASQAALARIREDDIPKAERFEIYINGIELANGFHELNNGEEQRQRFMKQNQTRKFIGMPTLPIDEAFLQALDDMPDCAGVALGIDRLFMIKHQLATIKEALAFDIYAA